MKLFYSPGACSLAPHIALIEAQLPYTLESVDLRAKSCSSGDFTKINPKGQVPTLRLEEGDVLTENAVMLQYIADLAPNSGLLPKIGSKERWHALEWLNFVATELHKGFSPLFRSPGEDARKALIERLGRPLSYLSKSLAGREFLMGASFSAADAYAFVVLRWHRALNVDLSAYPDLLAYIDRIQARPSVVAAMKAEGLAS